MSDYKAEYVRETLETKIGISLDLYSRGQAEIDTGMGYADHFLELFAVWAGFNLFIKAEGDLQVDAHHTLEDIGLCLGECFGRALGDKSGIERVGWSRVPMDEALAEAVVDISGRPYLVFEDSVLPEMLFGQEKDVWRELFKSFAFKAKLNLHINILYGKNGHHMLEAACKAAGLSLRKALSRNRSGILSTKGSLD